MFNMFTKEGPPVIVEVYVDGRIDLFIPQPPRFREKALSRMFQKAVMNDEIANIKPGRYHFNYTKVGRIHVEAEMTPAE